MKKLLTLSIASMILNIGALTPMLHADDRGAQIQIVNSDDHSAEWVQEDDCVGGLVNGGMPAEIAEQICRDTYNPTYYY